MLCLNNNAFFSPRSRRSHVFTPIRCMLMSARRNNSLKSSVKPGILSEMGANAKKMKFNSGMNTPRKSFYATIAQLEKDSYKTQTRLGMEIDLQKNPFGSKKAHYLDLKNHLCMTDLQTKEIKTLTSSVGKTGKATEARHDLLSPGQIMSFRSRKGACSSSTFEFKPQYEFRGYLKQGTIVRNKFTSMQIKKIYISHLKCVSRMLQIKRANPEFFKENQKVLHFFLDDIKISTKDPLERYHALCDVFREIFKDAKRMKL